MSSRFRGFLPVVVDVETGGFNAKTDALLEVAAVLVDFGDGGILTRGETIRYHVKDSPQTTVCSIMGVIVSSHDITASTAIFPI